MENKQIVKELLDVVGGPENIKNYEHCATRLRIVLKDNEVVDKDEAEDISEVKGYFYSTGQHQFVFGTGKVNEVYEALNQELAGSDVEISSSSAKEDAYANLNPLQKLVRILADILVPLIPVLVTTGLLMGLRGLLLELGLEMSDDVAALFTVLTDTAFAFLPVFITYSATRKFGGNPILGIAVGLMLVAPQLPNAYAVAGGEVEPLRIFGLSIYGYQGTIFPGIIAGWLISWFERQLRKVVPQVIDLIITPFFSITLTLAIMLFILGPIIQVVESLVINFIVSVIDAPLGIGYIIFAGLQQLLVVTGLHHSLSIIEISLLSDTGVNILNPLMTASMAGQFGAAIAAASLMKDQVKRSNMVSAAVPTLFGITEPLLFGVNLRSMRILLSGVAGGAVGGLVTYLLNLSATGMGITFIPGLLLYTNSLNSLLSYLAVIVAAFLVAFLLVRSQGRAIREELSPVRETVSVETHEEEVQQVQSNDFSFQQPMAGTLIPLDGLDDPVFASGAMGKGFAIEPSDGEVRAPFDGEVIMVMDSRHAIGLKSRSGIEVLIHVGIDTVTLNGQAFELFVEEGKAVQVGQPLMEADLEAIQAAGLSTVTPVVVTNSDEFSSIEVTNDPKQVLKVQK